MFLKYMMWSLGLRIDAHIRLVLEKSLEQQVRLPSAFDKLCNYARADEVSFPFHIHVQNH